MDLWEYLKSAEKPIVLYGMGNGADKIIRVLERKGIAFSGVFASDGFVKPKLFHGMPIESYATLKERFGEMIVLLCFGTHLPEVMENIKKIAREQELYAPDVPVVGEGLFDSELCLHIKDKLKEVYSLLADEKSKQTFENIIKYRLSGKISYLFDCESGEDEPYESFLKCESGESFLDLGAYNGDTALEFSCRCPDYSKIIAVEPDFKTFKKLLNNTKELEKIVCRNLCVSDFSGKGRFLMKGGRNSVVGEGAETEFSTVDDLVGDQKITFIKMDVEGEELKAVKGAKNTILEHKPKMIISAYHRTEDFWELPRAVLKIRPDYKVYMRHFSSLPAWDTAFYFV
ncbi:MAG: FkbM family methyltransferase [Clostridia bacterium]|nr:FkbM family methyltransferase [Clostridia bacterium]